MSPVFTGNNRRTFFDRAFGKLSKGSLRGSIFSLCASAIGSGVLSLPYVFKLCGWVVGIMFLILGAVAAIWSLFLIVEASSKTNCKNYSTLARKTGGIKLERFLQGNILFYMFGACISF